MSDIQAIVMPKWGLAMQEGKLTAWLVEEGQALEPGTEIAEIETTKITNALEATVEGTLRRIVARPGVTLPVSALLAVVADPAVPDADIDAFIEAYEADAEEGGDGGAEPEPQTVEVEGHTIRYLKAGEAGEAILLIHGFGGDLLGWMFNQPVLARDHAVYALDLPGHGGSSKSVGSGDLSFLASTVAGFMDVVGLDRAHLVGHSMGGAVALAVAEAAPDRVLSLTLIGPVGLGPEVNRDYLEGFIALQRKKDAKPILEMLFADPTLVSRDMIDNVLKYKRIDGVDQVLRTLADANFPDGRQRRDFRPVIGKLPMPVQVIWGAEDRIVPVGHAGGLPDTVEVHIIDAAGHMPYMETSGEVNRLIAAIAAS